MAVRQKIKLIGHSGVEEPFGPGVTGRTDINTFAGLNQGTGGATWTDTGGYAGPHARKGYGFSFGTHTNVMGVSLNDFLSRTGRLGADPTKAFEGASAGPFSVFSFRYYVLWASLASVAWDNPTYISTLNLMTGSAVTDPLVCMNNSSASFGANVGKLIVPGSTGNTSSTRINTWVRVEGQYNNAFTPKMVIRLYLADNTTPFQTWSYNPAYTAADGLGLTSADNGQSTTTFATAPRVALIEFCDTYDLDGEFPGGTASPATTTNPSGTGTPETEQQFYTYPSNQLSRTATVTENFPHTSYLYTYGEGALGRQATVYVPGGYPTNPDGFPVVFWAHSGFFVSGDRLQLPQSWRNTLLNAGYIVVTVEYVKSTLATGSYETWGNLADQQLFQDSAPGFGRYPSWIIDYKLCAARFAEEAALQSWPADTNRYFATGYSAGGYIALGAALSEGVTDDGSGRDLTIAGNTTYADGYTGADPNFLGAFCYAPPTNMQNAVDFDLTDPGLPPFVVSLAVPAVDDGVVKVAAKAFMGEIITASLPSLANTDIASMIAARDAIGDVPPVTCVWGTGDYLINKWSHSPDVAAAMSAAGAEYTAIDVPTVHDWMNTEFDPDDIVNFLNNKLTEDGGTPGPPTTALNGIADGIEAIVGVGVPTPSVTALTPPYNGGIEAPEPSVVIGVPTPIVAVTDEPLNRSITLTAIGVFVGVPPVTFAGLATLPPLGVRPNLPIESVFWNFYRTPWTLDSRGQLLTKATNKSITFSLLDPSTASFTIDGGHPEAASINELVDDILIYRNNRFIYRGRVVASADEVSETAHTVSFSATDYRGLMYRRLLAFTVDTLTNNVPTEQAQLAWRFINEAQGVIGGEMGITVGALLATGVLRADIWEQGMSIGEAIEELSKRDFGFDWSIDQNRQFNVHYPVRGSVRAFAAVYGGNVRSFSRSLDPSQYANSVVSTGTDAENNPIVAKTTVETIAEEPQGRWERLDSSTAKTPAELLLKAQGVLSASAALTPSYTLNMLPGLWTPDDCWLGDSIKVVIRKGRLIVDDFYRVQSITITTRDDGGEEVALTVGQPVMSSVNRLWFYGRRITELERR